jgi:hypothetical protein
VNFANERPAGPRSYSGGGGFSNYGGAGGSYGDNQGY